MFQHKVSHQLNKSFIFSAQKILFLFVFAEFWQDVEKLSYYINNAMSANSELALNAKIFSLLIS